MIDSKEQIIKKPNLLVKDDFFDDIINGLKSPLEEKEEKQEADTSRVTLGGKQRQRFVYGIVPIFANSLSKGNIIQIYIKDTETNYWRKKIKEIKETIDATEQEVEVVEEDVEDELEEIKSDKGGLFTKVLTKGRQIWKITSFVLRFYGYYKRVRGIFDPSKIEMSQKQYGFNVSNYDFSRELDREKAANDFVLYLNTTVLDRLKSMMAPMLYNMTKLIFAATDMAFHKINMAIYWMVAKEVMLLLADIALTIALGAATAALSWTGVGGVAGAAATAAQALRVANRVRKLANLGRNIYKAVSNVRRLKRVIDTARRGLNAVKRSRTVRRAGERAVNFLQRAKSMSRSDRRAALNRVHRQVKRIDRAGELADAGMVVFDLVTIDREEAYRERAQLRAMGARFGETAVRALDRLQRSVEEASKAGGNSTYTEKLFRRISSKTGAQIEDVTNVGLDFNDIGKAIEKLNKKFEIPAMEILMPQRGATSGMTLDGYTIDSSKGVLQVTRDGQTISLENKFNDDTLTIFKRSGVIREGVVKLAPDGGKQLMYDQDGYLGAVWLKFLTRDNIVENTANKKNNKPDVIQLNYNAENKETSDSILNVGLEKKPANAYEIWTKAIALGVTVDVKLKDLSDIIGERNTQLEKEKAILGHVVTLENAICNNL